MVRIRKPATRSIIGGGATLALVVGFQVAILATPAAAATTFNVTSTADIAANAGACGNSGILTAPNPANLSLREAACLANNNGGTATINIPAGTYHVTQGHLLVGLQAGQNVTLNGTAGAASTIVDAGGTSGVFDLDDSLVGGITTTVNGLTISGGADSTFGGAGIIGGSGTATTADSLTVTNSIITNNAADGATPNVTNNAGGGIQFSGGSLSISSSTISNNSSKSSPGAGVAYTAEGTASPESLSIDNTTFSGNTMTNTNGTNVINGGALYVQGQPGTAMHVTNSTFANNSVVATSGGAQGAAIREENGSLTVTESTFTGNSVSGGTSTAAGGAIAVTTGTATLHYNRITGNTAAAAQALFVGTGAGAVDATENWFGCNGGPGTAGCDTVTAVAPASAVVAPRLVLSASAGSSTVTGPNGTTSVTAALTTDSASAAVAGSNLSAFNGRSVGFTDPQPATATVSSGTSNFGTDSGSTGVTYNSHTGSGPGHVVVGFDNASVTVPITVNVAPAVTTNPTNQSVNAGDTASFTAAASGYPAPTVQWQVSTNGGSTFGNIAGATSTTYSFTAAAGDNGNEYRAVFTNGTGSATTTAANLSVGTPPAFTSGTTATFQTGAAGTFAITTSGTPTVTTIGESGSLPSGLSFTDNGNGTAKIAGTPAAGTGGTYPVTLSATNGVAPDASQNVTVQVNQAPAVTTNPSGQTVNPGSPVTFTAAASGVPTPTVQWQRSTDGGTTFTNIAGATSTSYTFTTAAGDNGNEYRAVFTNTVGTATTTAATLRVGSAPAFTSTDTTTFTVGTAGTFTVTVSGVPNATITMTGTPPAWVTLTDNGDDTATLTGTPPAGSGGLHAFGLQASNGFGTAATQNFTLTVDEAPSITSADHTTFTAGSAGSFAVTTVAGFPTATAITESGALPSGVTFTDNTNGTATLAGTPAAGTAGSYSLTIQAKATGGTASPASQSFTLTVNGPPSITSADHTTFAVGSAGSFTVTTSAGTPTATTITESGTLPSGVSFTDNGDGTATLAGTPAAGTGGSYSLTITASNGVSPDASQSFTLSVNQPPAMTSVNHATFTKNTAGSFTVTTSAGVPATTTITKTGTLPAGVSFTDNGDGTATIAGTPTGDGVFTVTIKASNGVAPDATQSFTLTVNGPPSITSADHTTFAVGSAGSFTVTTSAGTPTATTITESGTLPSGVSFTDNGDGTATLAGTPAVGTGGSYPLSITAGNGVLPNATQTFTLTVTDVPTVTSADHTTFTAGTAGSFTVTTSAGFPSTTTVTETGSLPSGVSFTDNGDGTATLSGTAAAGTGGTYPITIRAANAAGHSDQSFTLTVDEAPGITSADHATFTVGTAGSFAVTTGTAFPTPPSLTESGALPSGVTFTDNGDGTATLAGTPATGSGGVYPLLITASNGVDPNATQSFTLTVDEAPAITSADHTTFTIGSSGTFTVTTSGHPGAALTEVGALPSGVTFTDNGDGTATLAGTPAAGTQGSYPLALAADNGVNPPASQTFTLSVAKASQTITITSTPPAHPVVAGPAYTITATSTSGLTVTFSIDAATTNSACSISGATVSFDHAGTCVIDADQAGDSTYQAAPQVQQSLAVAAIGTAVAVASSASPAVFGQPVQVTATITADSGTPAGSVQFAVDGTNLGSPVTVTNGQAVSGDLTDASGNPLAPGSHPVTATFTPSDASQYAGSSNSVTQVVDKAGTRTVVAVHPSTITATVTAVAPGAGTPTGSVVFSVGGYSVGTAQLVNGVATLHRTVPPGLTRKVGAAYGGDTDFAGSSGSTSRHDPSIKAHVSSAHPKTRYGWYRSTVTITFTCKANGAPLTTACPSAVRLSHNGAGQSVTRTIKAADGGMATVVVSNIDIDHTKPSVRVSGVRNGSTYAAAPKLRCVARDALSGVAKCTLSKHTSGQTTRYRATATDKAGNSATVTGSYKVQTITLDGAKLVHGAYNIKLGHTYTIVVHSTKRPTYYDAAPVPTVPFRRDQAFRAAGKHRWALGVTMERALHSHKYWNLGVKIGSTMHVIRIRVS